MSLSLDSPLKAAPRARSPRRSCRSHELTDSHRRARATSRPSRTPFLRRVAQALRLAGGRARLRARGLPAGDSLPPRAGGRSRWSPASAILVSYYLVLTVAGELGPARSACRSGWPSGCPTCSSARSAAPCWAPPRCEWRAPRLRPLWRARRARCDRAARAAPDRRPGRWAGARESTHILDRYLVREYLVLMGIGLAVARHPVRGDRPAPDPRSLHPDQAAAAVRARALPLPGARRRCTTACPW